MQVDSSISKRTFTSTADPKLFEVDNLEEFRGKLENGPVNLSRDEFLKYQELKQNVVREQSKPNIGIRAAIESLVGIGRMTADVVIDNTKFTLRTLKARETKEIFKSTMDTMTKDSTTEELKMENRLRVLSVSLYKINEIEVKDLLSAKSYNDIYNFLAEMEDIVVFKLYKEYLALAESAHKKIVDSKEVIEEIKK